jgi:hypothetical protein
VRPYVKPPAPLFQRVVPRPSLRPWPADQDGWRRFQEGLVALPSPGALWRWYCRARAAFWARHALHRAVSDLAGGAVVAYEPSGAQIPASYWASDIDVDPMLGTLFLRCDSRVPICCGVQVFPPDVTPPGAAALAARLLTKGRPPMRVQPSHRVVRTTYGPRNGTRMPR